LRKKIQGESSMSRKFTQPLLTLVLLIFVSIFAPPLVIAQPTTALLTKFDSLSAERQRAIYRRNFLMHRLQDMEGLANTLRAEVATFRLSHPAKATSNRSTTPQPSPTKSSAAPSLMQFNAAASNHLRRDLAPFKTAEMADHEIQKLRRELGMIDEELMSFTPNVPASRSKYGNRMTNRLATISSQVQKSHPSSTTAILSQDSLALVDFYNSTGGATK
jgi:hypothetical protein